MNDYDMEKNGITLQEVQRANPLFRQIGFPPAFSSSYSVTKKVMMLCRKTDADLIHDGDMGLCRSADVATAHVPPPEESFASSLKFGKPLWGHDLRSVLGKLVFNEPFTHSVQSRRLVRRYKAIMVPSQLIKNLYVRYYGLSEEKIKVVPSGIDSSRFSVRTEAREEVRRTLGIPNDERVILFCGWDLTRKGLFTVLRALPRISNARVVVVGRTHLPGWYLELCRKLAITQRVVCVGDVPKIEDYFCASEVLALPSLSDAFGLTALEAMACGLPTIVSPTAGVSECVTDRSDGLVLSNPLDYLRLADLINELFSDEALRKGISTNARKTALRYDWTRLAGLVRSVYEEFHDRRGV